MNEEEYGFCKSCGEDYHKDALKNGYCIACSDEEFSIDNYRYSDIDEY